MALLERRLLLSLDVDANRFRFFVVELHDGGDGHGEVRRRWGRIGAGGRAEVEPYASVELARGAWEALLKRRTRRGYVDAGDEDLRAAQRFLAWHRSQRRAPYQLAFPAAVGF